MARRLGFQLLAQRLTRHLNLLVQRGDASERGLAGLAGLSQPHLHNLLKGTRGMTMAVADRLLELVNVPLPALLTQDELSGHAPPAPSAALSVPMLGGTLGGRQPYPGYAPNYATYSIDGNRLIGLISPLVAVLDRDEESVIPDLYPGDILLLDRNPALRRRPAPGSIYAASWQDRAMLGRLVRRGGTLDLRRNRSSDGRPLLVSMEVDERSILDVVRARVAGVERRLA